MYLCGALFIWLQCLCRPKEDLGYPGAGVTDACELLDLGAGEGTHFSARAASTPNH